MSMFDDGYRSPFTDAMNMIADQLTKLKEHWYKQTLIWQAGVIPDRAGCFDGRRLRDFSVVERVRDGWTYVWLDEKYMGTVPGSRARYRFASEDLTLKLEWEPVPDCPEPAPSNA